MCDCLHVDDLAEILKEKGLDKRAGLLGTQSVDMGDLVSQADSLAPMTTMSEEFPFPGDMLAEYVGWIRGDRASLVVYPHGAGVWIVNAVCYRFGEIQTLSYFWSRATSEKGDDPHLEKDKETFLRCLVHEMNRMAKPSA